MIVERTVKLFCRSIKRETKVKVKVQLAERPCGYDIVKLSECPDKKECGAGQCEFIDSEEEKAIDQLILDYDKQMDLRNMIREKMKDSNL